MSKAQQHRVLIVGAGSIGERHVRSFLASGRAQVSFVEVRSALRQEVANRLPAARPHASLEVALEEPFDCAVIATPAPLHVPQAAQLVDRGMHVLIEKPLSVAMEGVESLAESVDRRGVVAAVAYVYRANSVLAGLRTALASGDYGRPVELVAVGGQHFPFYRPAYRETYYASRVSGGGAIQDALTHVLNAGEWLVGPVDFLVADAAHQVLEGVDVEDTVHVLARHGDVLASYSLNQHQAPNELTITVACEHGTLRFESHTCRWRAMTGPDGKWTDHGGTPLERDTLFIRQAESFLDAIEGKAAVLCDLAAGAQTLRVNLAALESLENRSWVSLPRLEPT